MRLGPFLAIVIAVLAIILHAPPVHSASSAPLVGKWQRAQRCEEIVRSFKRAGLSQFAAEFIVGVGFQKGPVARVARLSNPCLGVRRPITRALVFQQNGRWVGLVEPGDQQVDGSKYRLLGADTLETAADGGLWDVFRYSAVAGSVTFGAVRPRNCNTKSCREEVAWQTETFGLGPWKRISS